MSTFDDSGVCELQRSLSAYPVIRTLDQRLKFAVAGLYVLRFVPLAGKGALKERRYAWLVCGRELRSDGQAFSFKEELVCSYQRSHGFW